MELWRSSMCGDERRPQQERLNDSMSLLAPQEQLLNNTGIPDIASISGLSEQEAQRDLSSPRALVIRGGEQQRIAGREVVCGDNVVLAEGDRVPADGMLLWGLNLSVDESLLTGESVPVRKVALDRSAVSGEM